VDESEVSRLKAVLADLQEREKRLVHLYTLGEFKEQTLRTESAIIAGQRQVLEGQLSSMKRSTPPPADDLDPEGLNLVSTAVARWLDQADESGKALVLEALQITVWATVDEARISRVLPTRLPDAIGDEPTSGCLEFKEQPGLPFNRAIPLAKGSSDIAHSIPGP